MHILIRRIPSLSLKADSIGRNPLDSPISSSLSSECINLFQLYNYKRHYNTLNWKDHSDTHQPLANFNIVTFNLLAPCYKRLPFLHNNNPENQSLRHNTRESGDSIKWKARAMNTLNFFNNYLFHTTSIIALQEFWLDHDYSNQFHTAFDINGYDLRTLQRTGHKTDAVAIAIKRETFSIEGSHNISLCSIGDRVALLLWIKHKHSGKDILIANTHLSFPHSAFDKINQMRQMKKLTNIIDNYAVKNSINHATRIILGDFNVQSESPVCDHLRSEGYYSCLEVSPPVNSNFHLNNDLIIPSILRGESPNNITSYKRDKTTPAVINDDIDIISNEKIKTIDINSKHIFNKSIQRYCIDFVSHRNHRNEDLGVDHIFIKPEYEYSNVNTVNNEYVTEYCTGAVFVDGTEIIPSTLPCDKWNDRFSISDHRPIGACVVFGSSKYNINNLNNNSNNNGSMII